MHICEVCEKVEIIDSEEAFQKGWDYPPRMGEFGIVGPRTCGKCTIDKTVWWAMLLDKKTPQGLTEKQRRTLVRILNEPASIIPQTDMQKPA